MLRVGSLPPISKSAAPMYVDEHTLYLGHHLAEVKGSGPDLLGNELLADPAALTLKKVSGMLAPLVFNQGYDKADPAHGGRIYRGGLHTFVGSRTSSVDACFDSIGSDVNDMGYPSMNQFPGKYGGRSQAIYKDALKRNGTLEGLWGGHLPIISLSFPRVEGGWIEFTAVPKPDSQGSVEQDVMFRLLKLSANDSVLEAKYYDTYVYTAGHPHTYPGAGQSADSLMARRFYDTVSAQQAYWSDTWAREGLMGLSLPARPHDTDGAMLHQLALHGIVRDMITRKQTFFPKYGVLPGVYGEPSNGGFEDTFSATMVAALEMGAEEYATGVLENWLTYYLSYECDDVGDNSTCFTRLRYRGPEMALHGHQLTIFAMFFHYTGDPTGILTRHFDKIHGLAQMLLARRAQALTLPKSSVGYGMPRGNDEADLNGNTVNCANTFDAQGKPPGDCVTELPYISIAGMMFRGFHELGPVLTTLGKTANRQDMSSLGAQLTAEAPLLLSDFHASLERAAIKHPGSNLTCHPHIPGWGCATPKGGHCNASNGCGPTDHSGSFDYPTLDVFCNSRTYPEAMWSGALPRQVAREMVSYIAHTEGFLTMSASDMTWCTFVQHGWGYGLILNDFIDEFLLFTYSMAAHSYTRGTWTAAECAVGDRSGSSSGYAAPSQALFPSLLKWMLVFEDVNTQTLMLARALPREWLSPNNRTHIERAPTRYGRLSFALDLASYGEQIRANVTLPATWKPPPGGMPGGLVLRLRLPGGGKIGGVTVGGVAWSQINATDESVTLTGGGAMALQSIVVSVTG
jgi:hypothetical protein